MRACLVLVLALTLGAAPAFARPLSVVCAEAVWCDIAARLGGDAVAVSPIVRSPMVDPHDVMATPDIARRIATADWLVVNGGGYDFWAERLAAASDAPRRQTIDISRLIDAAADANPHYFDDPAAVAAFAAHVTGLLEAHDPADSAEFRARSEGFVAAIADIRARIDSLRPRAAGRAVAVAEPIGGPLLDALGMTVIDKRLALSNMHHEEPAARDVAQVEAMISAARVAFLVVNPAVSSPAMARFADVARAHGVPVVPLTEMPAPGESWAQWYVRRIDLVAAALDARAP